MAERPIQNVTVYESEAKLSNNEPTLEDIGKGIEQLGNLASQVLAARGDSRKGILLEEHDELCVLLVEQVTRLQVHNQRELENIREEKKFRETETRGFKATYIRIGGRNL